MHFRMFLIFLLSVIFLSPNPAGAQENGQEKLVEQVKNSIDKGVRFLFKQQQQDGGFEITNPPLGTSGGFSCLAMLALLNAGESVADDRRMQNGLNYVRKVDSQMVYVRSLQTMVLAEAGKDLDLQQINENVKWLINARIFDRQNRLRGWGYTGRTKRVDNSNTQFALLGLLAARKANIKIDQDVWKSIQDYYIRTQEKDDPQTPGLEANAGGWRYSLIGSPHEEGASFTMTTAGLSGLLISGMELNERREVLLPGGKFRNCGLYRENLPVARAIDFINRNFTLELPKSKRVFYNLYGIERAGRLSGLRFFSKQVGRGRRVYYDWYREGCKYLVERQHADGSWSNPSTYDRWPIVSTSFALLFLSKGRTPVLFSQLVHGQWPRLETDNDWNNDRYAIRNLTKYVSKSLFKNLTLAWQNYDLMHAAEARTRGNRLLTEKDRNVLTSELLQTPLVFISGHQSPRQRFRQVEKDIIRKYVENGGFIFAEACCGDPRFDQGFRQLVQDIWPDTELTDLSAGHPVWSSHFPIKPGAFGLQGLQLGCKTVLVYAPQDLSCWWESNNMDSGKSQLAFRVGTNVVAYATGLEPPQPRLTEIEIANFEDSQGDNLPRGYLKVAQLRHSGDWQPAPSAMRYLMGHVQKLAGLDVVYATKEIPVYHENIVDYKFLYMHGRKSFRFKDEDLKNLRFNLKTGGLLFADACCGSKTFDESFRKFAKQLFPKQKLQEVELDDVLYSKELNGERLDKSIIRCRRERNGPMRNVNPWLEGIKVDDRWVILYSKYDIGCALEKHQSSDCLGYDTPSAQKIGSAAILYLLSP